MHPCSEHQAGPLHGLQSSDCAAAWRCRYAESQRIKPDYYDAFISMGNVEFERAKLSLGFATPPPQYVPSFLEADCLHRGKIAVLGQNPVMSGVLGCHPLPSQRSRRLHMEAFHKTS